MLFHVTSTHSSDDCPLYDSELRDAVVEAHAQSGELARELGITVHYEVTAAPAHVSYTLLEAVDFAALQRYLGSWPIRQEFTITPVLRLDQLAKEWVSGVDS